MWLKGLYILNGEMAPPFHYLKVVIRWTHEREPVNPLLLPFNQKQTALKVQRDPPTFVCIDISCPTGCAAKVQDVWERRGVSVKKAGSLHSDNIQSKLEIYT